MSVIVESPTVIVVEDTRVIVFAGALMVSVTVRLEVLPSPASAFVVVFVTVLVIVCVIMVFSPVLTVFV